MDNNNWNSKTFHIVDGTIVYRPSSAASLNGQSLANEYGPGGDGSPTKNKMNKKDTVQ